MSIQYNFFHKLGLHLYELHHFGNRGMILKQNSWSCIKQKPYSRVMCLQNSVSTSINCNLEKELMFFFFQKHRKDVMVHQATCCAKVKIFTSFFLLSSCGTGPNTRVPIGSPCLFTRTTALSSNLISLPSHLCRCIAARTTTQ